MDGSTIRRKYLDFFAARDHAVVPSASLIPVDPTLLLTVAGMVPFKSYLLGEETPPYVRAVSSQKCVRTEDIDIVGTTARHMTFFEMLGNFSFGDYFKEKAIPWAYEFSTEHLGIDPERIWVTVHETDDEAAEIWTDAVGFPAKRLQRLDKPNFWQMGVAGPCGPSSEIFYDKGPKYGTEGGPAVDEERYVEFWNLVFMQNIQDVPYNVVGDLPAKNIDTGMGLERAATILQGVDSLFDTDLVRRVISAGERATGVAMGAGEASDVSLKILGDHARAVTFLISDGVTPTNEGRGYILRRLLRRAVRHAYLLGTEEPIIPTLVEATIDVMADGYPELVSRRDLILETAEREESRFHKTLAAGSKILDVDLDEVEEGEEVSGDVAFKLHDTFGFPIDLTEEIARERGIGVDRRSFDLLMAEQRERARADHLARQGGNVADAYASLLKGVDLTAFTGYESESGSSRVLSIVREGEVVSRAEEGQDVEVFLDATPFYAESGGQVGDTGSIRTETGTITVDDTQYALPGVHGHRGMVTIGFVETGQEATAEIDRLRRERLRKNHTGTHLLHKALRETLGDHVAQAGSLVAPDRLRFDFNHYSAVADPELFEIERKTAERIIANSDVVTVETSKQEAEKMGAVAFFGDKYGENVRVVKAGDTKEFCGGTHVRTTGQVGPFVLVNEGSIGSNLRRVEALTGIRAHEHMASLRASLDAVAGELRTNRDQAVEATAALVARSREQQERIEAFEAQQRSATAGSLVDQAEIHGDHRLLVVRQDGLDSDEIRALADQLRDRLGSSIGVIGSVRDGKGTLTCFATSDLASAGVSAGVLLAPAAKILGGGGGRDPELAQAGGPNGHLMDDALEVARESGRAALLSL